MNQDHIKLCQQAALKRTFNHTYTPKTEAEAATWQPHDWVLDAIAAAVAREREAWNTWADAVIRDLERRAKLHGDNTIEISQGRLVELDALRARKEPT